MHPFDPALETVAVFGHPNHEIAILGTLARMRPAVIYLTDGGGEARVAQTKSALEKLGIADRAVFLNHSEDSFYQALLKGDARFFIDIAETLKTLLEARNPRQILCDAVEFYNPVHDVTAPMVHLAARDLPSAAIFEVPLVYQQEGPGERYILQGVPAALAGGSVTLRLSDEELALKIAARDSIYTLLADQMGPLLCDAPAEAFRSEVLFASRIAQAAPGNGRALRYEWRARKLREAGEIDEIITYSDHFVPVFDQLAGPGGFSPQGAPDRHPQ